MSILPQTESEQQNSPQSAELDFVGSFFANPEEAHLLHLRDLGLINEANIPLPYQEWRSRLGSLLHDNQITLAEHQQLAKWKAVCRKLEAIEPFPGYDPERFLQAMGVVPQTLPIAAFRLFGEELFVDTGSGKPIFLGDLKELSNYQGWRVMAGRVWQHAIPASLSSRHIWDSRVWPRIIDLVVPDEFDRAAETWVVILDEIARWGVYRIDPSDAERFGAFYFRFNDSNSTPLWGLHDRSLLVLHGFLEGFRAWSMTRDLMGSRKEVRSRLREIGGVTKRFHFRYMGKQYGPTFWVIQLPDTVNPEDL